MISPAEERPETITVDEWLAGARARLDRVQPQDLAQEMADGALVIDTRDSADREAEGALPGSVIINRNVLEWRMSPSSPTRLEGITADSRVIIVCNDGFSSSIAAAGLHDLGLPRATDLVGGYRAWRAATA
ncbi:MAG: rhodanese-like domain-containing protein [Acidimicrobiaceae bacterium]